MGRLRQFANGPKADAHALGPAPMTYKPKIVLRSPLRPDAPLAEFVEACLRDGVQLIAVYGEGCEEVHDSIDELIVGDGSDDSRFILTSWHTRERFDEVVEFARIWGEGGRDAFEVLTL